MSLRAIGYLLTRSRRRFSPRGIPPGEEGEEEVRKKVPAARPYLSKEAAIEAVFVDKDGKIQWSSYLNYVEHGKTLPDNEAFAKEARDYQEAIKKQEVKVDEATMKARFHDWMKEYDCSYSTEEEKARRYEIFKEAALWADKVNALEPRTIPYGPNGMQTLLMKSSSVCIAIVLPLTGRDTSMNSTIWLLVGGPTFAIQMRRRMSARQ
uniref:Cathepsin propeptide inhibitor domain-containing protein n=1 Tax=Oryza meridionalis TaxID=40149 RepID=A0A0E0DT77_9ORYZ